MTAIKMSAKKAGGHMPLINEEESSDSEMAEFILPPPRPRKRQRKHKNVARVTQTDFVAAAKVLGVLFFVAMVCSVSWLCYTVVQLQHDLKVMKTAVKHHEEMENNLAAGIKKKSSKSTVGHLVLQVSEEHISMVSFKQNTSAALQRLNKAVKLLKADRKLVTDLSAKFEAVVSSIKASESTSNKAMAEFNSEQELLGSRVDALEKVVGSLPIPSDEEFASAVPLPGGGLQGAVSYLMKNQSWVVGELSKARDSVGAAKVDYQGKADVVADLKRRIGIVEEDNVKMMAKLRRHHLNMSAMHADMVAMSKAMQVFAGEGNNSSPSTIEAKMLASGLNISSNSTIGEGLHQLVKVVLAHHQRLADDEESLKNLSMSSRFVTTSASSGINWTSVLQQLTIPHLLGSLVNSSTHDLHPDEKQQLKRLLSAFDLLLQSQLRSSAPEAAPLLRNSTQLAISLLQQSKKWVTEEDAPSITSKLSDEDGQKRRLPSTHTPDDDNGVQPSVLAAEQPTPAVLSAPSQTSSSGRLSPSPSRRRDPIVPGTAPAHSDSTDGSHASDAAETHSHTRGHGSSVPDRQLSNSGTDSLLQAGVSKKKTNDRKGLHSRTRGHGFPTPDLQSNTDHVGSILPSEARNSQPTRPPPPLFQAADSPITQANSYRTTASHHQSRGHSTSTSHHQSRLHSTSTSLDQSKGHITSTLGYRSKDHQTSSHHQSRGHENLAPRT